MEGRLAPRVLSLPTAVCLKAWCATLPSPNVRNASLHVGHSCGRRPAAAFSRIAPPLAACQCVCLPVSVPPVQLPRMEIPPPRVARWEAYEDRNRLIRCVWQQQVADS